MKSEVVHPQIADPVIDMIRRWWNNTATDTRGCNTRRVAAILAISARPTGDLALIAAEAVGQKEPMTSLQCGAYIAAADRIANPIPYDFYWESCTMSVTRRCERILELWPHLKPHRSLALIEPGTVIAIGERHSGSTGRSAYGAWERRFGHHVTVSLQYVTDPAIDKQIYCAGGNQGYTPGHARAAWSHRVNTIHYPASSVQFVTKFPDAYVVPNPNWTSVAEVEAGIEWAFYTKAAD